MPFSSGTFSQQYNWVNEANQGNPIDATKMNNQDVDIASGLSTCLLKDGTQTVTANIPMNGFKFTGVGNATAGGDVLNQTSGDARYVAKNNNNVILSAPASGDALTVNAQGSNGLTVTGSAQPRLTSLSTGTVINTTMGSDSGGAQGFIGTLTAHPFAVLINGTSSLTVNANRAVSIATPASGAALTTNGIIQDRFVYIKSSSTPRSTNVVPSDDPDLVSASLPVGSYKFILNLRLGSNGGPSGGFQYGMATSGTVSGATFHHMGSVNGSFVSMTNAASGFGATGSFATLSTTVGLDYIDITGSVKLSVAGTIKLQWAQNSSVAQATTLDAQSTMTIERIA